MARGIHAKRKYAARIAFGVKAIKNAQGEMITDIKQDYPDSKLITFARAQMQVLKYRDPLKACSMKGVLKLAEAFREEAHRVHS